MSQRGPLRQCQNAPNAHETCTTPPRRRRGSEASPKRRVRLARDFEGMFLYPRNVPTQNFSPIGAGHRRPFQSEVLPVTSKPSRAAFFETPDHHPNDLRSARNSTGTPLTAPALPKPNFAKNARAPGTSLRPLVQISPNIVPIFLPPRNARRRNSSSDGRRAGKAPGNPTDYVDANRLRSAPEFCGRSSPGRKFWPTGTSRFRDVPFGSALGPRNLGHSRPDSIAGVLRRARARGSASRRGKDSATGVPEGGA